MTDQPTPGDNQPTPPAEAQNTEHMIPKGRFDEVLQRAKVAEEALAKFDADKRKAAEAEALAKGEHEKIIADLKPKAERLQVLENTISGMLSDELAQVSEERRGEVDSILADVPTPEAKLRTLRNLMRVMGQGIPKPPPPVTNAGEGRRMETNTTATAQDIEWAARLGIPLERYLQNKRKDE